MACPYCYSRKIYDRFKWDKTIRFTPEELDKWDKAKPGSKIFVGSMIELFGDWVDDSWLREIFDHTKRHPDLTFQFLTKQPQNLTRFSPLPDNCWVGVTATDYKMFSFALEFLQGIKAQVKYISIEPMLDRLNVPLLNEVLINCGINLIIIGAQTNPFRAPKIEWVKEIVEAADKAGIPVFLKNNLLELVNYCSPETHFAFNKDSCYRQEMPKDIDMKIQGML